MTISDLERDQVIRGVLQDAARADNLGFSLKEWMESYGSEETPVWKAGDRVKIHAVAFVPGTRGVILNPQNDNPTYTITVRIDATGQDYPFRPAELFAETTP